MSRDNELIFDLVEACNLILEFTQGMDKSSFLEDKKTQSSVLYQLIILGEVARNFSPSFLEQYSNIPFAKIRGMRNRVTHEYQEVDFEIVWDVINDDILQLLEIISPLFLSLQKDYDNIVILNEL